MSMQFQPIEANSGEGASDDLVYHITHDLRAPLRAIGALPDWISEDLAKDGLTVPVAVSEHLDTIRVQAKRLDQMILDLQRFSRIGRLSDAPSIVSLETLIRQVKRKVIAAWPDLRLNLMLEVTHLRAPANEMALLFDAVLTNAVRHHDKTEAKVTIKSAVQDDWVQILISDDGPGIVPEFRERAFGLMSTLYSRDAGSGSGVGLALVRRIVANLAGHVTLEDTADGRGVTVQILLPASCAMPP